MRCIPFDKQDTAALRALKFSISEDEETAKLTGEMQIEVARPGANDQLLVSVTMPSGDILQLMIDRVDLLEAAGLIEEDDQ